MTETPTNPSAGAPSANGDKPLLHYTVTDRVMHIVLDRPPVNAINNDGLALLRDTFNGVNDMADVSAVVVSSASEKVFSAGADFKMLVTDIGAQYGGANDSLRVARETMYAIHECPVPVIAAARGIAIGVGAALLGLADLVVGGPGTQISLPEVDRGVVAGAKFLNRFVGEPLMRKILITGCVVGGDELNHVGAFADYVPDDEIVEVALAFGETAASKHPMAIRFLKQSFIETQTMNVRDSYRLEQKYTALMNDLRPELVPGGGKTGIVASRRIPTQLVKGRLLPTD